MPSIFLFGGSGDAAAADVAGEDLRPGHLVVWLVDSQGTIFATGNLGITAPRGSRGVAIMVKRG